MSNAVRPVRPRVCWAAGRRVRDDDVEPARRTGVPSTLDPPWRSVAMEGSGNRLLASCDLSAGRGANRSDRGHAAGGCAGGISKGSVRFPRAANLDVARHPAFHRRPYRPCVTAGRPPDARATSATAPSKTTTRTRAFTWLCWCGLHVQKSADYPAVPEPCPRQVFALCPPRQAKAGDHIICGKGRIPRFADPERSGGSSPERPAK
jgi:hypothetical protein